LAEPEVTDVELEGTPAWWWMPLGTARLDEGRIEGFAAMGGRGGRYDTDSGVGQGQGRGIHYLSSGRSSESVRRSGRVEALRRRRSSIHVRRRSPLATLPTAHAVDVQNATRDRCSEREEKPLIVVVVVNVGGLSLVSRVLCKILVLLMSLTTSCFDIFSSATMSRPFAMFSKSCVWSFVCVYFDIV
jgi:hypothetical protein